ncbi:MAG: sialidase family protein [Planctomycetota bacterium]|nr:sialidase family protein [Planctomycetota bacterium]
MNCICRGRSAAVLPRTASRVVHGSLAFVLLFLTSANFVGSAERQDKKPVPVFEEQPLFQARAAGYSCYRISALLFTTQGTMLAFAEARKNNCSDHGDVDLVPKRRNWLPVTFDDRLPEPSCQGAIIRMTDVSRADKNRILLAAASNPNARSHMRVSLSYDECRSWPVSKIVHEGSWRDSADCRLLQDRPTRLRSHLSQAKLQALESWIRHNHDMQSCEWPPQDNYDGGFPC